MPSPKRSLLLMQARSELRRQLPVQPANEDGIVPFNFHALEGFLFAIIASPLEIEEDTWGYELDRLLPDSCYEDENHADHILALYDDMEEALEQDQHFRIHTLPIPKSLPSSEFYGHPLWFWTTGYIRGLFVVQSELRRLPKKVQKKPGFRKFYEEYEKSIGSCLKMLPVIIRSMEGQPLPEPPNGDPVPVSELPLSLSESFDLALAGICSTAMVAASRLKQLL